MRIGRREFDTSGNCYIMGILNVTPDSFSDGGRYNSIDTALYQTEKMLSEGMDIVDIGGESTRPGYTMISDEEEIQRVVPVIEAVKSRFDVPVSLDTYKYRVAEAGISAGADLINDIWGLKYDSGEMAAVIAGSGLPCCLMHNRRDTDYNSFFSDVTEDMRKTLEIAEKAGISREKIIADPGVGFAKSYENNLEIIDRLDQFRSETGLPVLLGASRKSVIGAMKGVSFVRVHDIKENARAVRMAMAVVKGYKNGQDLY